MEVIKGIMRPRSLEGVVIFIVVEMDRWASLRREVPLTRADAVSMCSGRCLFVQTWFM